jgi:excisionase family DNA binding protein
MFRRKVDPKFMALLPGSVRSGISVSTLRRLIRRGELTAHRPTGAKGKVLLDVAELDQFVRDSAVEVDAGEEEVTQ